jgi:hypothetical protein
MNRGTRYRIQTHPTAPRARYVEGSADTLVRPPATWTTKDIAIAAAVSRIGCPVIDITGVHPHRCFILPRYGHPLPGRFGPEDAQEIVKHLLTGELERQCPEHPVVWGYYGRKARKILLQTIDHGGAGSQVFMNFARSSSWQRARRSVLVEERAPNHVLDHAVKHLRSS